jgi:hypothetical protein
MFLALSNSLVPAKLSLSWLRMLGPLDGSKPSASDIDRLTLSLLTSGLFPQVDTTATRGTLDLDLTPNLRLLGRY